MFERVRNFQFFYQSIIQTTLSDMDASNPEPEPEAPKKTLPVACLSKIFILICLGLTIFASGSVNIAVYLDYFDVLRLTVFFTSIAFSNEISLVNSEHALTVRDKKIANAHVFILYEIIVAVICKLN